MSERISNNPDAFEFKSGTERERITKIGPVLEHVEETLHVNGHIVDNVIDMSVATESSVNAQALEEGDEQSTARTLFDLHRQLTSDLEMGNSVEEFCANHPQFPRLLRHALTLRDRTEE